MTAPVRVHDDRLAAFFDAGPPDIGTVWELCMYFEFEREKTVAGIAEWLGPPAGLRVLDCACGSGFPALGLIARGYDVTCTDGSELMLEHFRRNARIDGLDVRPHRVLWEDLPARYAGEFDVVLNRGCGNYRYAGVWDRGGLADRGAMAAAIGSWAACLRPGGRLYVDIPRDDPADAADPADPTGPADPAGPAPGEDISHPTLLIGDHVVELAERIVVDPVSRIRIWSTWLTVDGVRHSFERRAHHIRHSELVEILTGCGLVEVQHVEVPGEYYHVYSAVRPAASE